MGEPFVDTRWRALTVGLLSDVLHRKPRPCARISTSAPLPSDRSPASLEQRRHMRPGPGSGPCARTRDARPGVHSLCRRRRRTAASAGKGGHGPWGRPLRRRRRSQTARHTGPHEVEHGCRDSGPEIRRGGSPENLSPEPSSQTLDSDEHRGSRRFPTLRGRIAKSRAHPMCRIRCAGTTFCDRKQNSPLTPPHSQRPFMRSQAELAELVQIWSSTTSPFRDNPHQRPGPSQTRSVWRFVFAAARSRMARACTASSQRNLLQTYRVATVTR